MKIDKGFKPIIGKEPKVLILGTMPSVRSLETQQYYGHPRNAFWWIMSELCNFDATLPYPERVDAVLKQGIAIWDVIASCHRPGSLDSKIDQSSVTPNKLPELISRYPSLKVIVFNGQAAEKLFKKFIDTSDWQGINMVLPSTSPANAAMNKQKKLSYWAILSSYLGDMN